MRWPQIVGSAVSGICLFVGLELAQKRASSVGILLAVGSLFAAGLVLAGLRGPMIWVQGGGTVFAAFFGAQVFYRAVKGEIEAE